MVQPDSTPALPFPSEYADPDSHALKAVPYPERPFYPERHAVAAVPNPGRQAPAAPAPSPERPTPAKVPQKRVLAQSLQAKNVVLGSVGNNYASAERKRLKLSHFGRSLLLFISVKPTCKSEVDSQVRILQ